MEGLSGCKFHPHLLLVVWTLALFTLSLSFLTGKVGEVIPLGLLVRSRDSESNQCVTLRWTEATFVGAIIIIAGMIVFLYREDLGLLK